jgi:hypothetical protein
MTDSDLALIHEIEAAAKEPPAEHSLCDIKYRQ